MNEQSRIATATSAAKSLLLQLKVAGIDYLFVNGGSDFPPIVEAFAGSEADGSDVPRPIVVSHENPAVAMAHGVYLATGRMQAVMVHVNVGTANTMNALIDASREQIPLLLLAGRTPYSVKGHHGSRTRYIHWAQEMFDQAGMLREFVKWDYELRLPDQAREAVNRAVEIAQSSPKGPVYLTLPREVLAAADTAEAVAPIRPAVAPPSADPGGVRQAADWLKNSKRPLVVTANAGRDHAAFELLSTLADRHAIPVVSFHQRFNSISTEHNFNAGYESANWVREADVILAIDCDVPWVPALVEPNAEAKIVHVGEDPIFSRYPMRGFHSDLSMAATPAAFLDALLQELADPSPQVATRRDGLVSRIAKERAATREQAAPGQVLTPEYISRVISDVIEPDDIIVNEYTLRAEHCVRTKPGTYFGLSPAGGLGWGFGAALGIKLAKPEATVIATLGDGAYIFANPTACHWVSQAHGLPVLTIVFNNALHGAVRNATQAMYPQGAAASSGGRLLADLSPSPAFECLAGTEGLGLRVETVEALRPAIEEALAAVRAGRQALVNVICDY